jgi:acetyl-CoA carboxylase biotin carboxyl carrier protein
VEIDFDQIRILLSVVAETDITELTIENGAEKITVKKGGAAQVVVPAAVQAELAGVHAASATAGASALPLQPVQARDKADSNGAGRDLDNLLTITSPMVGTFYRASSPQASPFVDVGDRVSVGQTVCIIEAMKLMNDLPSEVAGRIVKILVENGHTVEFGQPLFLIDPKG